MASDTTSKFRFVLKYCRIRVCVEKGGPGRACLLPACFHVMDQEQGAHVSCPRGAASWTGTRERTRGAQVGGGASKHRVHAAHDVAEHLLRVLSARAPTSPARGLHPGLRGDGQRRQHAHVPHHLQLHLPRLLQQHLHRWASDQRPGCTSAARVGARVDARVDAGADARGFWGDEAMCTTQVATASTLWPCQHNTVLSMSDRVHGTHTVDKARTRRSAYNAHVWHILNGLAQGRGLCRTVRVGQLHAPPSASRPHEVDPGDTFQGSKLKG